MRQVRCILPPGGAINVVAGAAARTIVRDDVVDLDQVLVKAVPPTGPDDLGRAAVTLEVALGHHVVEAFEAVQTSAQRAPKPSPAAAAAQE